MDAKHEPPQHYNEETGLQDADKPLHSLIFGPRVLKHFSQPKQRTDVRAGMVNDENVDVNFGVTFSLFVFWHIYYLTDDGLILLIA